MSDAATTMRQYLQVQRRWYQYFNQGVYWKPNGRPPVDIVEMEAEWRHNCRRFLERSALLYARNYADGCEAEAMLALDWLGGEMARESVERVLDDEAHRAQADPVAWIKTTVLYKALGQQLPTKGKKLRQLATRASHFDGCPRRTARKGECHCYRLRLEVEERDAARRRQSDGAVQTPAAQ